VRNRLEAARASVRVVDACADDRNISRNGSERLRALDRRGMCRFDENCLDATELGIVEKGLVPQAGHDEREELANLGMGLADEYPGHALTIGARRSNVGCIWYGTRMKRSRILVVDDDRDIRGLLHELLARAGYDVAEAESGKAGLRQFYASPPDLVLLDVSMPELDGWQTLERIRDLSEVPVMMLTARAGELEKVRGLKSGADDYVTKPFGRQELLARVEALLRRSGPRDDEPATYGDGTITIDFAQREVAVGGNTVALTPLEFKLLTVFVRHPNQVLSHEQLLELVWGDALSGSRARAKLYVGYLRHKLAEAGAEESLIETVRGFGYRYRPKPA
jgi:DNA-binding response OmpR family regulator